MDNLRKYLNVGKNVWKVCCNQLSKSIFGLNIYSTRPSMSYEVVYPVDVSPPNTFPDHQIPVPEYYNGGTEIAPHGIRIKTKAEIESMKLSSALAWRMLNAAKDFIKVGVTTDELDRHIHNLIIKNRAYPSTLHYNGFPKSICTSVNNVACHGIPDMRKLKNGDIITVDVTVFYKGFHGDCAATFLVGDVDKFGKRLVRVSEDILYKAISVCKPGEPLQAIGDIIDKEVARNKLCVIPKIFGHGIGRCFHEEPEISHTREYIEEEIYMEPGMVFTIEPTIGESSEGIFVLDDNWTLITDDDSRTAQFEHTILITNTGSEILTK